MRRLSHIVQDYRDTGAMSTLISLYGFVDDSVFLTKGGDLGMVAGNEDFRDSAALELLRAGILRVFQ